MIKIINNRIFVVTFFVLLSCLGYSQETVTIDYDEICNYGGTKIIPTEKAKAKRLSSKRTGTIEIDDSACGDMPDSLKVALNIAKDVWSGYLSEGSNVIIKISWDDMQDVDIKTSVSYKEKTPSSSTPIFFPSCLYKKLLEVSSETIKEEDGTIHINKNTKWHIGIGNGTYDYSKNLTNGLLKAFAHVLGFGSSIRWDNGKEHVIFPFNKGMSIFDSLIFSANGLYMKDLDNNKLKDFVQQESGFLYVSKASDDYRIYAPNQFDERKSLKYLLDENSLMYYNDGGVKDLVIDGITLDLLNTIGWDLFTNPNIEIIGEGIDDTGITSAYSPHKFYIKENGLAITNHEWEYQLPLKNGGYETVATSSEQQFTIPAISDGNKYEHTIEGDIRGLISFKGLAGGAAIKGTYNLTLELKPHILSAQITSISPNANNENSYDAVVDVYYEGSHYVHSYVEEEHSEIARTFYSDKPYYTQLKITDIDSGGCAWVNITIRNDYGSDNVVLEISNSDIDKWAGINKNDFYRNQIIKVYSSKGYFIGTVKSKDELKQYEKGLLILKLYDNDGVVKTMKYINR